MSSDILDAIDNAVRDWETSPDAMRSRPGGFDDPSPAHFADYQEAMSHIAGEMSRLLPDGYRLAFEAQSPMISRGFLTLSLWQGDLPERGSVVTVNRDGETKRYRVIDARSDLPLYAVYMDLEPIP